ncbi:MAG: slt 2 [Candidatus Saccharibacteria bacterium]|nr:slt 2 [Candidatus Saccharibacteria bacterium]
MRLASVAVTLVAVETVSLIKHAQLPLKPQAATITIPWLPATVQHWKDPINEMSKKYKIDPDLVAIIMTLESGGFAKAHSSADAQGLMQITPPTAKEIAAKFLKKPRTSYDLADPRTNIEFGTAYLAYLRKEFGTAAQGPSWNSTVELIAAGYNGGPGAANNLEKGRGLNDTQTVVYSRDIFNMWRERHAASSPTYNRWLERGGSTLIDTAKAQ